MKGLQRKCLFGSVLFHGLLLVILVVGSAFLPKNPPPPPPAFELFDAQAILVDQPNVVSGGNPDATAPPVAAPPTLTPAPQPVAPRVEEVKPPTKLPDPVKETAKQPEKKSQPEPEPIKPEKSNKPDPDAFDLSKAVTKKSDKTEHGEKEKSTAFDLSKAEKKTIKPAKDSKETSDGEENARGEKEKKLAMARTDAISGVLKNLQGGLSKGGTSYDLPGPGGAAYASYDLYLKKLYETAWVPPQAGRGNEPAVEVEIVIARDGTVLSHRVVKPSGRRELDNTVSTVLRRINKVRPLPEGGTDQKRTFRINFNLTETPSVG